MEPVFLLSLGPLQRGSFIREAGLFILAPSQSGEVSLVLQRSPRARPTWAGRQFTGMNKDDKCDLVPEVDYDSAFIKPMRPTH